MHVPPPRELDATGLRIALAVSRYHDDVTGSMSAAAERTFLDAGGHAGDLLVVPVAGAFELTAVCNGLAQRDDLDGVVAIGCVIRGETSHDEHICRSIVQGLTDIIVRTGKPIAFGVLTCHTMHQAKARSGLGSATDKAGKGNKGQEAMAALIETIETLRRLESMKAAGERR